MDDNNLGGASQNWRTLPPASPGHNLILILDDHESGRNDVWMIIILDDDDSG